MRAARGAYVIWLRELLRFVRQPSQIVGMFAQPLLFLLLVGNGIRSGFTLNAARGADYLTFMFPGIAGMSVLFTSLFSAVSIVWDREFGFLKEVLVSPVPRWAIVLGKAAGGVSVAVVQGAILLLLAPAVGVRLGVLTFLAMLGVLALVSLTLVGLGILIASRMESMQGFQVIMNFLVMPMFFLSGLLSVAAERGWKIPEAAPTGPCQPLIDALRHIVYGSSALERALTQFPLELDLAVTAGVAAVLLGLASWAFTTARNV
ncbi:MAG: ABC transporter permease [Bacillota bacterium]|nr:ABC transporter permease [Bacillota bacterium]